MPASWMADPIWQRRLTSVVFPKYPRSVSRGSRLVDDAAGKQWFCAVMEVIADEPTASGLARWPYELALRPLVAIPADEHAPSLSSVEFDPLRVRRQSHIRLTEAEYSRIVDAICRRGGRDHSLAVSRGPRKRGATDGSCSSDVRTLIFRVRVRVRVRVRAARSPPAARAISGESGRGRSTGSPWANRSSMRACSGVRLVRWSDLAAERGGRRFVAPPSSLSRLP